MWQYCRQWHPENAPLASLSYNSQLYVSTLYGPGQFCETRARMAPAVAPGWHFCLLPFFPSKLIRVVKAWESVVAWAVHLIGVHVNGQMADGDDFFRPQAATCTIGLGTGLHHRHTDLPTASRRVSDAKTKQWRPPGRHVVAVRASRPSNRDGRRRRSSGSHSNLPSGDYIAAYLTCRTPVGV